LDFYAKDLMRLFRETVKERASSPTQIFQATAQVPQT
jgi:hypothetical protein